MAEKIITYRVVGKGEFPMDMLRYDASWPADSESASKLAAPPIYEGDEVYAKFRHERRVVKLNALHSFGRPTAGRWSSFGWVVVNEALYRGITDEQVEKALTRGAPN